MTTRRLGLSFRIDPTRAEIHCLARAAGARRFAYNQAIALIHHNHASWAKQAKQGVDPRDRVRPLSHFALLAAWKLDRPEWHPEVSSWVYSFAARDAASAHQNYMARRGGFPRFAKKKRARERFTVIGREVRLEGRVVGLPKIGTVRIASPDPQQAKLRRLLRRGRARITSATVSQRADGSWWVALQVERALTTPAEQRGHPQIGPPVGIDRGSRKTAFAADAQGDIVGLLEGGRYLRDALPQIRRAQRTVERRTRPGQTNSRNRTKAVARLGKIHARVVARRTYALHQFSKSLTRQHAVIVLETLTTKNLVKNRFLAGAILDQGWAALARQLQYKAMWRGGQILLAPGRFPSSKTCSACGAAKAKLPLSQRTYRCEDCGLVLDRDVNAAATLAAWGEHQQGTCPCHGGTSPTTQARDPHPAGRSGGYRRHACGGWVSVAAPAATVLPDEAGTSLPHLA